VAAPVIALEGPADIRETGMLNKAPHIYISKKVFCSPCIRNTCPRDMECMKAISVDDVMNAVRKLL
ncbi:MAG: lipopolysaccharide heptosyltransferase II, partial [bacterium]|nr:lipopolysaccharide heptosyltransferase II [bacterium]